MQIDKWRQIVNRIKDDFEVEEHDSQLLEEDGGTEIEYIVFRSPLGLIRLEIVIRPTVVDKKTIYSRRIGSETKVEYVYSDSEKSAVMTAYIWSEKDDDWKEIDAAGFNF